VKGLALASACISAGALLACAALSGLDAYSAKPCAPWCADSGDDWAEGRPVPSDMSEAGTPGTVPDDLDGTPRDADDSPDTDTPADGLESGLEGELAGMRTDAAPDGPSCGPGSCAGCCTTEGLCAAGGLDDACGTAGAACLGCTVSGLACTAGTCGSPPLDAGGDQPECNASACANLCVPYFIQCCKADQSCGCALLFPRGPCN
jgi:hypothetical protein